MCDGISRLCVLCISFWFLEAATQRDGVSTARNCPEQRLYGVDRSKFTWAAVADGQSLSQPICLDVRFNVVTRTCVDGRWEPETVDECYSFRCPTGYLASQIGCRAPRNSTDHDCTESESESESSEEGDYCDYPQSFFLNLREETGKHVLKYDMATKTVVLSVQSSNAQVKCYANEARRGFTSPIHEDIFDDVHLYHFTMPLPAYYWCQVFEGQNFHPSVTERVTGRGFEGHFFVMETNGTNVADDDRYCSEINCISIPGIEDNKVYFKTAYDHLNNSYQLILQNAKKINKDVIYLRSTEFCLPETFDDLHWKLTPMGADATPDELCLDGDGQILTRKCEGDIFSGAVWSPNRVRCSDVDVPQRTKFLHDVLHKEIDADVLNELAHLDEFSSNDLHFLSKGLKSVSPSAGARNFLKIISNAMRANLDDLRRAQATNSTDEILDAIENFVGAVALDGPARIVEDNFMVEITNPGVSNVTGLAVYRGKSKSFSGYRIVELYANQSLGDLQTVDLELAVQIPENLLRRRSQLKIIIEIFYNDSLFVDENNRWGGSKVVGVKIPGVDFLPTPITVYLRKSSDNITGNCAYWDYGAYKKGHWATDGGATLSNDSLTRCSFTHLTHFALLILSDRLIVEEDVDGVLVSINPLDAHDLYLTIITGVGCALSFVGAIVIFSSAILLKSWHAKRKFTVQLTLAVVLELAIFQLAAVDDWQKLSTLCSWIGATLHYVILSKFAWMLLVAYVQHSRFIKIFDNVHVSLLKAVVIGWIAPLLLTTLSVVIYSDSYKAGALNFCYVKGDALYIFLLLPIVVVASVNIAIISLIMVKVSGSQAKKYNKSGNLTRKQVNFAVLLFFMLGVPWVFGLTAEFIPSVTGTTIFVYVFCLTATMQGFVMFVFNVVLDADSRKQWKIYLTGVRGKQYSVATATVKYTSTNEDTATTHFF